MSCVTQSALLLVETPDSLRFPAKLRAVASATLASTLVRKQPANSGGQADEIGGSQVLVAREISAP